MINMLKMDLFRMFKTRSMYVIWMVMAFMIFLTTPILKSEVEQVFENANGDVVASTEQAQEDPETVGISVSIDKGDSEKYSVYDIVYGNVQARAVALFVVIFAVLFATADLNSGYIKNIGGQVRSRGQLVLSKTISIFVFTIMTFLVFTTLQTVANGIFLGYIKWGNPRDFLFYSGTQILLHFALAVICMAIAIFLRNNVVSMIFAVCLCMNIMTLVYSVLEKLIHKMGAKEFEIMNYTVTGNISRLSKELTNKDSLSAICISVVFIVIMGVLGSVVFEKRDI